MKPTISCGYRVLCLLLVAMMSMLAGCGGGGGSSSGAPAAGTGTVAVFVKDSPTDEFEHIWVTITQVELLPVSGSPVIIFENPRGCTIDLLDHRSEDFFLTIHKKVPAGTYTKIRLRVTNIELVPTATSSIGSDIEVKLPSGKIDLNPRGPFTVESGQTLSVRLDFDANKAINLHPSKPGWYIFRPVIFVDVVAGYPSEICLKLVHGTITELTKVGNQTTGFVMALESDRGTLEVKLNSGTEIFGADGEFVGAADLAVGQEVRVKGQLDTSGALVASLVIVGDVVDVLGDVEGPVASGLFPFTPFTGEELVGQYNVRVDPDNTLVLADCGTKLSFAAIQAGLVARVFGKLVTSNSVTELRAVIVILRTKEITGEIMASTVNVSGDRLLTVKQDNSTTVDVTVPSAAPVYMEGDGRVSADLLTVGRRVRILLNAAITTPLTAKAVYIEGEKVEGTVQSVGSNTMIVKDSNNVSYDVIAPTTATILDLRSGGCSLVLFSTIKAGYKVVFFGLSTATPGTYEAPVILIVD
jgi:cytoskeletal protein CcmA (bactofilin family)